ncbi:helix-turn-helix domain-containing protein [Undibacterium sp.]|uniref:winged helix-turn-helix transcriptional regulator n=1 Tax=Undibacterium sp. TaxID=1914977 RepID=UPI002BE214CE|nr:helix-turn-helix domain-containing protein [Undibacterium sp.]HTD04188.1 helix-turn-helix domain-containing protein [Undibacterium sp.]
MAKRKSLKSASCPVARSLDVIGDRWSMLIIRDAFDGMRRFGEFQKSLGVAKNILADRLHTLVEEGVLEAAPASDGTAYQEYLLTAKGRGLFLVVVGLRQWGEDYLFSKGEPHSRLMERGSGKPVQKMELRSRDGTLLEPDDTVVKKLKS